MLALILLTTNLTTATLLCAAYFPKRNFPSPGFFATTLLLTLLLTLASALACVLTNHWTLLNHWLGSLVFLIAGLPVGLPKLRQTWNERSKQNISHLSLALFSVALLVGISLQSRGIYHLYATHDPSAYLNAALNLTKTSSFFHRDELSEKASESENSALQPILPEAGGNFVPLNFGTIPTQTPGQNSYHGIFASTLFLAIGIKLFGLDGCLKMHWLLLLASLLMIVAITKEFASKNTHWPYLGALLFAISPLIVLIYREPLSEPLSQVFFLGACMSLIQFSRERTPFFAAIVIACVLASLTTRVSGMLYLPFLALSLLLYPPRFSSRTQATFFLVSVLGATLLVVHCVSQVASTYLNQTLSFYLNVIVQKLRLPVTPTHLTLTSLATVLVIGYTLLAILGKTFLQRIRTLVESKRFQRTLWVSFALVMALGLAYRYGKLLTSLTQYYGGIPFITYHLESLLFYAGPVLVVVGLFQWLRILFQSPPKNLFFLQTYFPFCLFFYLVFRFLPLDLQPNFQRYLIIELIPLSIVGAIIFFERLQHHGWQPKLARVMVAFNLLWCTTILAHINHNNYSENSVANYEQLSEKIEQVTLTGRTPTVVSLRPSWETLTFLYPLSFGYQIPVLTSHLGFTHQESKAIDRLFELDYEPILAKASQHTTPPRTIVEFPHRVWQLWTTHKHCYDYPPFFLSAPPLELKQTCHSLALYLSEPNPGLYSEQILIPKWSMQPFSLPFPTRDWVGFHVNGAKLCQLGSPFSAQLRFDPDPQFIRPKVELNGKAVNTQFVSKRDIGKSFEINVTIPSKQFRCHGWNEIDVFAFSTEGYQRRRSFTLVQVFPEPVQSSEVALP